MFHRKPLQWINAVTSAAVKIHPSQDYHSHRSFHKEISNFIEDPVMDQPPMIPDICLY